MNKTYESILPMMTEAELQKLAYSNQRLDIRLTNDFAFKKTFENKTVLKGFLMALLNLKEEEIRAIQILNPYVKGASGIEKEGILDIKLHLNNNQKINIEMQVRRQCDWDSRSVFYNCKMFTEGFDKGRVYGELEPSIHVSILDFNQMESPGFHHFILLRDQKTGEIYNDKLLFHVIELKKLEETDPQEKETELYKWAKLIAALSWEEICMEAKGNPYREAAVEELEKINQSQEERYRYLSREKAILDKYSELKNAETRGRMKGRQEGRQEGRLEGRQEERIETVIEILGELGTVSSELRRKISMQTNLDILKNWTKLAAKSQSVEEFETALENEKN